MWAGCGDREMKTEIHSESRAHREKETKTGYGRKLTTNSCPTRVSERRQWAELGMRNMKLWKSEERCGKGNGERDWLAIGTQGGMYYICTLWASGSKQSKKSNTCIWGENKTRHILQPFNDADLSALLRGSTRRKCPFPETFTMPFSVSRGNTNLPENYSKCMIITFICQTT